MYAITPAVTTTTSENTLLIKARNIYTTDAASNMLIKNTANDCHGYASLIILFIAQ